MLGDTVPGRTTIRPSLALSLAGAAICIAVVAGCAVGEAPSGQPSFNQILAQPDMTVDPAAAASMISGYRSNNGLGPVSVDPDLMRMANEQAIAMAQHDTMNYDIGKPFKERVGNSPFANVVVVENVSAGYHTLAEAFSGWRELRRIAPICSIAACRGSASPPPFPRTPNTRCSGRSFSPATRGRASEARERSAAHSRASGNQPGPRLRGDERESEFAIRHALVVISATLDLHHRHGFNSMQNDQRPCFRFLPRQAYSGSLLERAAALRGDDAKLAAFLEAPARRRLCCRRRIDRAQGARRRAQSAVFAR